MSTREDKERARLLYVGFTRARDHLVLAVRVQGGKAKTAWLDALHTADGSPLLEICADAADGSRDVLRIGSAAGKELVVPARMWRVGATLTEKLGPTSDVRRWFARGVPETTSTLPDRPCYRISPSNAQADWPELLMPTVGEVVSLGGAMPIDAKVAEYDVLGDAVHAFLASDVDGLTGEERLERARRLLASAGLVGVVRPDALVEASDRLRLFIEQRWPGAVWHREVGIDARVDSAHGARRVAGIIDLLLETADGYVMFDHKTFPGRSEAAWRAKVVEFLPQFGAYAAAIRKRGDCEVLAAWVHLPVGGGMVKVEA